MRYDSDDCAPVVMSVAMLYCIQNQISITNYLGGPATLVPFQHNAFLLFCCYFDTKNRLSVRLFIFLRDMELAVQRRNWRYYRGHAIINAYVIHVDDVRKIYKIVAISSGHERRFQRMTEDVIYVKSHLICWDHSLVVQDDAWRMGLDQWFSWHYILDEIKHICIFSVSRRCSWISTTEGAKKDSIGELSKSITTIRRISRWWHHNFPWLPNVYITNYSLAWKTMCHTLHWCQT